VAVTSMGASSISRFAKSNRASGFAGPFKAVVSATTGSPTITTDGTATIYTFTGDGSITFSKAGKISVFGIGGGGGSKGYRRPSGGGAGKHYENPDLFVEAGTETITIGAGGSAGGNSAGYAGGGGPTLFGSSVFCNGGSGAFSIEQRNWQNAGGGSGGPSGGNYISNTQNLSNVRGQGSSLTGVTGVDTDISGSTTRYGTGGDDKDAVAGPANSGDGAGGWSSTSGKAGGSGVFIVRVG